MKNLYTYLSFIFLLFPLIVFSQNQYLDNTFGVNGMVATSIGYLGATADGAALQTDGKIVVIASYNENGEQGLGFITLRFNKDGSLDKTFGNNGIDTSFSNNFSTAYSVAIQYDGKIVVAGQSETDDMDLDANIALVRYNSDGSLDKSFGVSGKVLTVMKDTNAVASSMAIMPDGKIVTVGTDFTDLSNEIIDVHIYYSNGKLFKKVETPVAFYSFANVVAVLPNSEIIVGGGGGYTKSNAGFVTIKYDSLLNLDTTFGSKGIVITKSSGQVSALAVASNGKIVEGGTSHNNSIINNEVIRYDSNGLVDNNFGKKGKIILPINGYGFFTSLLVQADQKIVFTGTESDKSNYNYINTVRLKSNGELDSSFAINGIDTTSNGIGMFLLHQPDDKLIVAGAYNSDAVALFRYDTNGEIDKTFNKTGIAMALIPFPSGACNASAIQKDGKILAAGYAGANDGNFRYALARYNINGNIDTSFGLNGKVTSQFIGYNSYITATALQSNGQILAAGSLEQLPNINILGLVRYNQDGTIDSLFGRSGEAIINSNYHQSFINSLAIQEDNKFLTAGYYDSNFLIVRYNQNGSLDSSFASDGIDTMKYGESSAAGNIFALPNGKIIITGSGSTNIGSFYFISRFNSDGTTDTTFANKGIDTISFFEYLPGIKPSACQSVIQIDSKILIASQVWINNVFCNILARFKPNGNLDSTFGINGVDTINLNYPDYFLSRCSPLILNSGKIVIGATDYINQFMIMQFDSNGNRDSSFGLNGRIATNFPGLPISFDNSICLQPDGKIVLGGNAEDSIGNYSYFAMARYISNLTLGVVDFSSPNSSALIYPNPIHQSATLKYIISSDEDITIDLFDVNGKLVKCFINEQGQAKGNYTEQLNFDSNISCGNYFLVISNGKEKETVKIIKQ